MHIAYKYKASITNPGIQSTSVSRWKTKMQRPAHAPSFSCISFSLPRLFICPIFVLSGLFNLTYEVKKLINYGFVIIVNCLKTSIIQFFIQLVNFVL